MDTGSVRYRRAFEAYIRKGVPIGLDLKQARPTTHYIWRTRGDGKVRSSHAANNGRVFAWADPPPTGHPGEDYECRCRAEPYVEALSEFFSIEMFDVSDVGEPWDHEHFIYHYFLGGGSPVTVRGIGHLEDVVAEFRRQAIDDPTRLPGQIADVARKNVGKHFDDTFINTYEMEDILYELGGTVIKGKFHGRCVKDNNLLEIAGNISFELNDAYRDPLQFEEAREYIEKILKEIEEANDGISRAIGSIDQPLRDRIYNEVLRRLRRRNARCVDLITKDYPEVPGGTPFAITDKWSGTYTAKVFHDKSKSRFRK